MRSFILFSIVCTEMAVRVNTKCRVPNEMLDDDSNVVTEDFRITQMKVYCGNNCVSQLEVASGELAAQFIKNAPLPDVFFFLCFVLVGSPGRLPDCFWLLLQLIRKVIGFLPWLFLLWISSVL